MEDHSLLFKSRIPAILCLCAPEISTVAKQLFDVMERVCKDPILSTPVHVSDETDRDEEVDDNVQTCIEKLYISWERYGENDVRHWVAVYITRSTMLVVYSKLAHFDLLKTIPTVVDLEKIANSIVKHNLQE